MPKNLHLLFKSFRSLRKKRVRTLKLASRHPFAVPLITFLTLFAVVGLGYLGVRFIGQPAVRNDANIVIISHDGQTQVVPSRSQTVGQLLQRLNINLHEGDVVEPAQSARISQDEFRVNIYRAVPVQIVDGAKVSYGFSAAKTPRSVANQISGAVFPEDNISTKPAEDFVRTGAIGTQVLIDRSVAVNINLYGTPIAVRTHADTVADLIKQNKISVAAGDEISPAATTPLTPNTQIFISRNGVKIESVNEDIAMPVQNISDPTLAYGTNAVRQVGSAGKRVVTYQNTLRNGIVTGRSVLQTVVTVQPVTQIVVVGSSLSGIKGDMALAGIAPSDYNYVDYIISHESGWRPQASNPSGAYGLCQALPGSKMASAGADWATNPITQLRWCSGYATSRYGSWAAAYNFWVNNRYW